MDDVCLVYVTASDQEEAEAIAATAVGARLAACANILGGIQSVFFWNGEVQRADETALILKTTRDRLDALTECIQELHAYDEPCIVALPIVGGSASFLAWIVDETRPRKTASTDPLSST